ncbi:GIY-YIG nuclease family protein [Schleiferiaceae bacterium]|nr:GIY-YIG nuclease family protein [Schleiferiaceae bacterium]
MGWVYVLINPSMDGIYKVGMTEKNPEKRAKELSATTSVATPFIVIYKHRTHHPRELEYEVHKELEDTNSRISNNREFFNGDPSIAIRAIIRLAKELNLTETQAPDRTDNQPWTFFEKEAFQYLNGEGEKLVDALKAEELFRKAKKLGSRKASIELIKLENDGDWTLTDKSVKILTDLREAGELEASYLLLKHYDSEGVIFNSIKLAKEILSKSVSLEKSVVKECTFHLARIAIKECPDYGYDSTKITLEVSESIIQFLKPFQNELISYFDEQLNNLEKDTYRTKLEQVLKDLGILSTLGRIYSNERLMVLGYYLTKDQIKEIQKDIWCNKAKEIRTDLLRKYGGSYPPTNEYDHSNDDDSNPPILVFILVVIIMLILGTLWANR